MPDFNYDLKDYILKINKPKLLNLIKQLKATFQFKIQALIQKFNFLKMKNKSLGLSNNIQFFKYLYKIIRHFLLI